MVAWFDIAEALTARDDEVPDEWEFNAGIGRHDETDDDDLPMWTRDYTSEALIEFGCVLSRYSRMLRAAGRAY